jgi:hypothetical protein
MMAKMTGPTEMLRINPKTSPFINGASMLFAFVLLVHKNN